MEGRATPHKKLQSAMEYLMTYGWAILVIAVALGVLYSLGVFNANNFAPKAQPGSCQVFRPNGPGTTSFISLEGVCNGELPEYVASFSGSTVYNPVPGFSSSTYITSNTSLTGSNYPFTITMWVKIPKLISGSSWTEPFFGFNHYQAFGFLASGAGLVLHRCSSADTTGDLPGVTNYNIWHFVAVSFNPNTQNYLWQIDDSEVNVTNTNSWSTNSNIVIGAQYMDCDGNPFVGYISNVQVYNTSLSANAIQALYQEGIGGAPIDLQNLVGWWPLNGNANDYSGNGNNGVPSGVTFVSNWYSGYTSP
ncbi:MAG: LamG-like jellyroll fold domain-containing protein [Candidatus Micrarchaeaceae archaeon]